MLGVDKMDQLVSYYSFLHNSVKWWKKVFFVNYGSIYLVVVNSYIIYKEQTSTNGKQPITHLVIVVDSLKPSPRHYVVFFEHVLDLAPLRHLNIYNLCSTSRRNARNFVPSRLFKSLSYRKKYITQVTITTKYLCQLQHSLHTQTHTQIQKM